MKRVAKATLFVLRKLYAIDIIESLNFARNIKGDIMSTKDKALTKKHLLGYTFGDFGECMTFSIMGSFLTRYYVNVALIDMGVLAVLTLVWKIWDTISNPIVGMFLDKMFAKKKYQDGKFRPWMLRATPLVAITAILVFTAPTLVDGMGKLVVIFTTYLLYELAYNLFNIPYGSLLAAMAKTDEERAKLSSARGVGGMLGSMIPMVLFPIVISVFEQTPQLGYSVGVTVSAIIGFVLCFLSYRFTEERCMSEEKAEPEEAKVTDIFETLTKNKAVMALCIHGVCQGLMMAISQTMGTYMFSDVLGNMALMSVSSLITMPFTAVVLAVAPKLVQKMGTIALIKRSSLLGAAVYVILFALHITTNINVWTHIMLSALAGIFTGVGTMMQWGLVGTAIDYNEQLLGKRTEGTIYGTFNMIRRLGQAIGASGCVALLGVIGYDVALSNAGMAQSPVTIIGIKALCILAPAIAAIGSWAAFAFVWNIAPVRKLME